MSWIHICTYIKQGISMQDFKEWSPEEKALYSKNVGHFLTDISVALTITHAINLIKHGKEIALYHWSERNCHQPYSCSGEF